MPEQRGKLKKILFVDDERQMQQFFLEGIEHFNVPFEPLIAENGKQALKMVRDEFVSVVITDLKMPKMDGLALLRTLRRDYSDIPVIIISAYGTDKIKDMARKNGAVLFLEKPCAIEKIIGAINAVLKKESDGGTLHGITPGMFLQLMEMEEKTCTVRLFNPATEEQGVLFFVNGNLLDARIAGSRGMEAAYEIFAWDNVSVSIQNSCRQKENRINSDLQGILLEAMRRKDEQEEEDEIVWLDSDDEPDNEDADSQVILAEEELDLSCREIQEMVLAKLGRECLPEQITVDGSCDTILVEMARLGEKLGAGRMKVGFVDTGAARNFILLPGRETRMLAMNRTCPRDKIMDLFSR